MREVILADSAGFCFGVKRAVDIVYEQVDKYKGSGKQVYSYGPIIHNEEVIKDLEQKGVKIISKEEISKCEPGVMVIRSHGIGRKDYEAIKNAGHIIVDTTCPFVSKIHKIVDKESSLGKTIIVIGDKEHSEVKGIIGWSKTKPIIIDSTENIDKTLENIPKDAIIVSQTTFNSRKFQELVEIFSKKDYNICVNNTICNSTSDRQNEVKNLSSKVDAMIVIGGKNSSNTQKLYEISKEQCANTYYIQTLVDLDLTAIESAKRVGITAGASTPNYIIEEVQKACQN